ncbi:energy transducer TonB [Terriglobus sp.]|uniref:energy transducer TonB n=1 Tax=Terriglobus sp. TaxID=1889013 RepID=UPI003B000DD5
MLNTRRFAVVLLCLAPVPSIRANAQSAADALNARLLKNVFFLRSLCFNIPLRFNEQGELGITCNPVPFTVGLVQIDHVDRKDAGLDLRAHRVGLLFKDGQPQPFDLARVLPLGVNSRIDIHIAPSASGDYGTALDHVFAKNFTDMYADVPEYWHAYFLSNLVPKSWRPSGYVDPTPIDIAGRSGATIPKVTRQVDAQYTEYAKAALFSGSVIVGLVVDTDGSPTQIHVYTPAGLGLDEQAVKAVSQYRFKPATKDGVAVPVKMNVDVSFQIR